MTLSKNHNFYYRYFFTEIMSQKMVFRYLWKRRIILSRKNRSFEKSQKWTFFKGASLFIFSKNRSFSYRRISQKFYKENNVFDIVERKEGFEAQKIEVLKRAKKWTFSKGSMVHGFCPKIELSLIPVFHRKYVRKDLFWIF